MAKKTVTLAPNESKQVTFEVIPADPGVHYVTIDGLTGTFSVLGEPPTFLGFSLMIANPPAGSYYWTARDKPIVTLPEALWWAELPPLGGWVTKWLLEVVFLDIDYQCPVGDPMCLGAEILFVPEDGRHYLFDISSLTITENPNPPEVPS